MEPLWSASDTVEDEDGCDGRCHSPALYSHSCKPQEPLPSDEASAESGVPTETLEINIVFLKT